MKRMEKVVGDYRFVRDEDDNVTIYMGGLAVIELFPQVGGEGKVYIRSRVGKTTLKGAIVTIEALRTAVEMLPQ